MFLTGDHASRPAASAVGVGSLYSCTTHDLIYQSDGSSWTTWATVGGGGGGGGGLTHTYYGRTTTGASWLTTTSARVMLKKITLASAGMLMSIGAHIRQTADTSSMSVELFSDSGGNPGILIGHSRAGVAWQYGDLKLSASGTGTGRWVDFPLASYLAAGSYWLGVAAWKNEGSNIDIAYDATGGSDRYYDSSQSNGGYLLDPASVTSPSHNYSIRASVLS